MLIIHHEKYVTAINCNQIIQISYSKADIAVEYRLSNSIYLLEIVFGNGNGEKYNKKYDNYDECHQMFNELMNFMKSNNKEDNTFDFYL